MNAISGYDTTKDHQEKKQSQLTPLSIVTVATNKDHWHYYENSFSTQKKTSEKEGIYSERSVSSISVSSIEEEESVDIGSITSISISEDSIQKNPRQLHQKNISTKKNLVRFSGNMVGTRTKAAYPPRTNKRKVCNENGNIVLYCHVFYSDISNVRIFLVHNFFCIF